MNINVEISKCFVRNNLLSQSQADLALEECESLDFSFQKYVLTKNLCKENQVYEMLANYFALPYVELEMLKTDINLLKEFGFELIKKHLVLPIKKIDNTLIVAIAEPYNLVSKSCVASFFNGNIEYILTSPTQIKKFIDSLSAKQSTALALDALKNDDLAIKNQNIEELEEEKVKNTPAVRLLDSILKEAIMLRASDIHIEPSEKKVKVRYRIDGDLVERAEFLSEFYPAICARLKIMSGINIAERRIPQDGRMELTINDVEYDFRTSTLPTIHGEKFVVRILDKTSFSFSRKELGFNKLDNDIIDKTLSHPHGIVLLTGPTGCGKSTTLYSFLKELNKPNVNIVTVEDPVEYSMEGINQTQVNTKANMTFASALRSILRQDPDVIMIGEIRDNETAQIAIRAAITGHLVLSTLHTNDAPGAISRLIDMGISSYLVADALVCVISQRLVKKLCPVCKKKSKTTQQEMNFLGIDEPIDIYKPNGCQFCNHTGYRGRTAVLEIMYVNEKIRQAINENTTLDELRVLAHENGMLKLYDSCREYVKKGVTSISELLSLNID